jgi:hypothetical protein
LTPARARSLVRATSARDARREDERAAGAHSLFAMPARVPFDASVAARLSVACGRRACYAKPARALRRRNAPRFVMTRRRAGDGDATAPLPFVAAARGAVSLMIGRMRPSRGGLAKSNSTPGEFYF